MKTSFASAFQLAPDTIHGANPEDRWVRRLWASVILQALKDIKKCQCGGKGLTCRCLWPTYGGSGDQSGAVWTAVQYVWRWHKFSPLSIHCALARVEVETVRTIARKLLTARYPDAEIEWEDPNPDHICFALLERYGRDDDKRWASQGAGVEADAG